MEVLSNGFKANFWIPIEDEPDIDRFVDEQMMIDMGAFMLVCTLEKVSTCKKKNEEKEFEYFKQITVQVNNICSAANNNINIVIPAKKEEFLCDVSFRYAPEPEIESDDPVEQAAADAMKPDHFGESPSLEDMIAANEALSEDADDSDLDELDELLAIEEENSNLGLEDIVTEPDAAELNQTPEDLEDLDDGTNPAEEPGLEEFDDEADLDEFEEPDFEETVEEEAERLTGDGDDISDEDIDSLFDEDAAPDAAPEEEPDFTEDDLDFFDDEEDEAAHTPSEPEAEEDELDLDEDGIDWGD